MSRDLGTQAAIRVHGQHALACELVLACGERGLGGPHGPVGAGGVVRDDMTTCKITMKSP